MNYFMLLIIPLTVLAVTERAGAITAPHYQELQHETLKPKHPHIPIVKQDYQLSKEGYKFSYETGNGIHVQESGHIKSLGDKKHAVVQQGSYTYHDEHGHPITVNYVADEHGFRAQGAHLPTPPPNPHGIHKSLQHVQHQPVHQVVPAHQEAELQQVGGEDELHNIQYQYY